MEWQQFEDASAPAGTDTTRVGGDEQAGNIQKSGALQAWGCALCKRAGIRAALRWLPQAPSSPLLPPLVTPPLLLPSLLSPPLLLAHLPSQRQLPPPSAGGGTRHGAPASAPCCIPRCSSAPCRSRRSGAGAACWGSPRRRTRGAGLRAVQAAGLVQPPRVRSGQPMRLPTSAWPNVPPAAGLCCCWRSAAPAARL